MPRGIRKKAQIMDVLNEIEKDLDTLRKECDEVGAEKCNYSTRFDILHAKKEILLWVLKED